MKKLTRTMLAMAGIALLVQGCKDNGGDTVVNVKSGTGVGSPKVTYVIQVVDAAGNSEGRVAGIPGVSISYRDAAGNNVSTATKTDAQGYVTITNAAPGSFTGRFASPGYADMDFTADLNPPTNNLGDSGAAYVATTRLYAVRRNAYLRGRVYGDYSSLGTVNPAQPTYWRAVSLKVNYNLNNYPMGAGPGRLTDINFTQSTDEIATGVDGLILADELTATQSGLISAHLTMRPYAVHNRDGSVSSFILQQDANNISLDLSSGDTLQLGNLLATPR